MGPHPVCWHSKLIPWLATCKASNLSPVLILWLPSTVVFTLSSKFTRILSVKNDEYHEINGKIMLN